MNRLSNVAILGNDLSFPDPLLSGKDGLVAIGGDLSPERLILAYRSGIFPWSVNPITWWSPESRGIFELEQFKPQRRIAKLIQQNKFDITINKAFREVMEGCASPAPGREESWITQEFIDAYSQLHAQGLAHSLECWQNHKLVGGIYGVAIGSFFAGESMFYFVSNASKVALTLLILHLKNQGFTLFDTQIKTNHTSSMGAISIPRKEYIHRLKAALKQNASFID